MHHPPEDDKGLDLEYKKLSESISTEVLLKLDKVESEGNEVLRAMRKQLIREIQRWLEEMDRIVGKK